jgi:hypothetical protein
VDDWSQRAAADGTVGPVRPLVLHDAGPRAQQAHDQWLLGTDLLAAPILEVDAEEREVYLPDDGDWERVEVTDEGLLARTGEVTGGGQTIRAAADLTEMPLFVRVDGDEALPFAAPADQRPQPEERRGPGADGSSGPPASDARGRPLPATGGSVALGLVVLALATAASRGRG